MPLFSRASSLLYTPPPWGISITKTHHNVQTPSLHPVSCRWNFRLSPMLVL